MSDTIKLGVEIATVDRIAELSAEIADLNAEKSELLNQLKAKGEQPVASNRQPISNNQLESRITNTPIPHHPNNPQPFAGPASILSNWFRQAFD